MTSFLALTGSPLLYYPLLLETKTKIHSISCKELGADNNELGGCGQNSLCESAVGFYLLRRVLSVTLDKARN